MNEFSELLLIIFLPMFLLSFAPVNYLVKRQSNNIMLGYNLSILVRFTLVVFFIMLGAGVELLVGIGLGTMIEIPFMLRCSQEANSREVLA